VAVSRVEAGFAMLEALARYSSSWSFWKFLVSAIVIQDVKRHWYLAFWFRVGITGVYNECVNLELQILGLALD